MIFNVWYEFQYEEQVRELVWKLFHDEKLGYYDNPTFSSLFNTCALERRRLEYEKIENVSIATFIEKYSLAKEKMRQQKLSQDDKTRKAAEKEAKKEIKAH